jgi:hypothetical protein
MIDDNSNFGIAIIGQLGDNSARIMQPGGNQPPPWNHLTKKADRLSHFVSLRIDWLIWNTHGGITASI